ncbi:hypothetical protein [Sorangium sp. So ce381]|uniref:hypothetical protein n=1 Tax=Sorangium sp. So ce381 TaxID=3133307 RepID=UPI003F5C6D70
MRRRLRGQAALVAASLLSLTCGTGLRTPDERPGAATSKAARVDEAAPPISPSAPTERRLIVSMSAETASALAASAISLYAFKAVGAEDAAGVPLVWFQSRTYSLTTTLSWAALYRAYTETRTLLPSARVDASASYDIEPGQALYVQEPTGTGVVLFGGPANAVSIQNDTSTPFTCGLAQRLGETAAPIASFPLYGKSRQVFYPMETVLLVVAASRLRPGDPATTSPGPGVLVELGQESTRRLAFEINEGWSWGSEPWAMAVSAGADILPLLVVRSP